MALTSKQLALRARELSARLMAALENREMVPRFLEAYVQENDRRGVVEQAERRHELLSTIGREALLAMLARAQAELPRHLTRRRPAVLQGAEVRGAEAFRAEAIATLARTLRWAPEEVEEFRRDLDLYAQMGARQPAPRGPRSAGDLVEGPFADRIALLLDPSLMEKARRAARKFLAEIEPLAEQALAAAFRAKRS
jgi:hypothetical protein